MKRLACLSDKQRGATTVGYVVGPVFVCRACLCNAHNALCNRHGVKQPLVTVDLMPVARMLGEALARRRIDYDEKPYDEVRVWLEKFFQGKRDNLWRSIGTDAVQFDRVKCMVKREVSSPMPKKARLIQFYPNGATQAATGPKMFALQGVLMHSMRRVVVGDVDVTAGCGLRPFEVAEWMRENVAAGATWFYERDGKSWDGTMGPEHAHARQFIYSLFDEGLAHDVSQSDIVKALGRFNEGELRYMLKFTVKSGHNDTTLGNTLVNAIISVIAFRHVGVKASVLVTGDDMIACAYGPIDVDELRRVEGNCGIIPESRVFRNPFSTSFVSAIWVTDGNVMGFVPKPGRLLSRLWWTINPPSPRRMAPYLRGVARGLHGVCHTIPVIRIWLQKFDSEGEAIFTRRHLQFAGTTFDFGDGIYSHFATRYGVTERDLRDCEDWLRSLPPVPGFLEHPVLARMVEVDCVDLPDREDTFGSG